MALNQRQRAIQAEGLARLDGIRILTTWKYLGAIVGMIIGAIFLSVWVGAYLFYYQALVDAGVPGVAFWIVTLVIGLIFVASLWQWYLVKSLREFRMWAYDLMTAQSAMSTVGSGMQTISAIGRKDWGNVAGGIAKTAIEGGITAYLLKGDVRSTFESYSQRIHGGAYMDMDFVPRATHANRRANMVYGMTTGVDTSCCQKKAIIGMGLGIGLLIFGVSLYLNKPVASTSTFMGYGIYTIVLTGIAMWVLMRVLMRERYGGSAQFERFPGFMCLVVYFIIGIVGLLVTVGVTEMVYEFTMPAFICWFSVLLAVVHFGLMLGVGRR